MITICKLIDSFLNTFIKFFFKYFDPNRVFGKSRLFILLRYLCRRWIGNAISLSTTWTTIFIVFIKPVRIFSPIIIGAEIIRGCVDGGAYRVNPVKSRQREVAYRSILCRISVRTLPVVAVITVHREIRKCSVTRKGNRPQAKLANSPGRNPRGWDGGG